MKRKEGKGKIPCDTAVDLVVDVVGAVGNVLLDHNDTVLSNSSRTPLQVVD